MSFPYVFNAGAAYFIDGDAAPTPTNFAVLQSASLDLKATTKKLYGNGVLPVASGRSQIAVSGKVKFADYQPRMIRDFFGSSMATGQTLLAQGEAHPIPASGPYTVTVTNSATIGQDLGVVNAATGVPMVRVASGPTTGQYSYAAGVYTFAAADEGLAMLVSYSYTSATGGETITISNASAGAASVFKAVLGGSYQGLQTNFVLNACIPSSLKLLDAKIGDFSMPEYDFDCITDATNTLGSISVAAIS